MSSQSTDSQIEIRVKQARKNVSNKSAPDFAGLLYSVGEYLVGASIMYIDSEIGVNLLRDLEQLVTDMAAKLFFDNPKHPALKNLRAASNILGEISSTLSHQSNSSRDRVYVEAVRQVGEYLFFASQQLR